MYLSNFPMILKMSMNPKILKIIKDIYNNFKKDENFKRSTGIKMLLKILEGEKITYHEGKYIISTFLPPIPSKASYTHAFAVTDSSKPYTCQMYSTRSAPISMYISVTNQCIYNCTHCSAKGRKHDRDLTTDEMKGLIGDLQDMGTAIIGFTGGEPLLRKDITEIIKSVDERSVSILFTSGTGLTLERAKELKEAGLFGMGISLDSADEAIHNQRRQNNKLYKIAIEAVRSASKAGIYTMVQTVVPKQDLNEDSLFKLFKLSKELGAKEVKILEPIRCGNLMDKEEDIFYTEEDRKRLIEIQHTANKDWKFPKITTFAYTESKEKFGCGAGNQHSYISPTGDLYPCDFVPLSFGNVKQTDIPTLWKEMSKEIGKPKIGCFAFRVADELERMNQTEFPLEAQYSKQICTKCKSKEYPDFYKVMQGKKKGW